MSFLKSWCNLSVPVAQRKCCYIVKNVLCDSKVMKVLISSYIIDERHWQVSLEVLKKWNKATQGTVGKGERKCFTTTIDSFLWVDLLQCNNPKTKEPKLSAAVRIVPEWSEYDNEIKQFLKQLKEQKGKITHGTPSPQHTGKILSSLKWVFFSVSLVTDEHHLYFNRHSTWGTLALDVCT